MAINTQKLLPSSSPGQLPQGRLVAMKTTVINIENILKGTVAFQKRQEDIKRKKTEDKKFKKREEDLEKKKTKDETGFNLPSLPKMGFFSWIRNFVTNILLGYFIVRIIKYLPQLQGVLSIAGKAFDGVIDIGGKMLNGLATFVEWGYKAYDATRGFLRDFGGDNVLKLFDQFTSGFDIFLNLVLGYNALSGGLDLIGPFLGRLLGGIGFGAGAGAVGLSRVLSQKQIQTYLQRSIPKIAEAQKKTVGQRTRDIVIRRKSRVGRATILQDLIGDIPSPLKPTATAIAERISPADRRILQQMAAPETSPREAKKLKKVLSSRARTKFAGAESLVAQQIQEDIAKGVDPFKPQVSLFEPKGVGRIAGMEATNILKSVRPFLKRLRIPVIGALIDFGLSVALGEDPGRAAFKAIGAGLLGGVGAALGSVIPVAGNLIGGIAGGTLGDLAGGALYDFFFGNKSSSNQKGKGFAGGGVVTRAGKIVDAPPTRGGKRETQKRTIKEEPQPTQLKPGSDVGGDKQIKKMFPEPEIKDRNKQINPYGYVQDAYKNISDVSYFGPLFGLAIKTLSGDKPDSTDYRNASIGLSNWMISSFGSVGAPAYATGGIVKGGVFTNPDDLTKVVEKSLEERVSGELDIALNDLKRRLGMQPILPMEGMPTVQPGQMIPGSVPGGQLTAQQLVGLAKGAGFSEDEAVIMAAIAFAESSGVSNKLNNNPNTGDLSYGLWQINMFGDLGPERRRLFGISSNEQLFDPVTNAKAAYTIKQRQGFGAWTVYKTGAYKTYMSTAQAAKGAPSLATSPVFTTGKGYDGYITGDPLHPNYDPSHGGANYHDHLSFADRATAERAYKFFVSKGFKVTEFKGYGAGVTGPHSGMGSLHHSGLAFDVPGDQVPVGQEQKMSQRVRAALSEFKSKKSLFGGGPTGRGGLTRTHPGEYVVDKDSVDTFGHSFFDIINQTENLTQRGNAAAKLMNILSSYIPGYDPRFEQTVVVPMPQPQMIPVPVPSSGGTGGMMMPQTKSAGRSTDILELNS